MAKKRDLVFDISNSFRQLAEAVVTAIKEAKEEGREEALAQIRSLVGGGVGTGEPVKRGRGRPLGSKNKPKSGDKRKNSWSGMSPEGRLKRVNAIRKGKGLPPKTA